MTPEPDVPFEAAEPAHPGAHHAPAPRTPGATPAQGPSYPDSEDALLSACLIDEGATLAQTLDAGVRPETFPGSPARAIFAGLQDLRARSLPITLEVLFRELRQSGTLPAAGGMDNLLRVTQTSPTTAEAKYHTDRVLGAQSIRESLQAIAIFQDEVGRNGSAPAAADSMADLQRRLASAARPARAGSSPFQLWTPAQFIAHQPDPSACLLGDGFIERGEWTSLVGIGGLGKTRLALWFSICQITGREFCGIPTNGIPQKTIILSTENGLRRWKSDLEKFYTNLTPSDQAKLEANLRIQALTAQDDADLNLGIPETVNRLRATLSITPKPGLVIFDPFADMVDGDENKTTDLVQTLQTLRRLTGQACPEAAILIIHHARTGAQNVAQAGDNYNAGNFGRGSKALFSKVRCELQLAPQDRDDPTRLVLACGKANNTQKFNTRGITFDPESFQYGVDFEFDVDAWRDDIAGKRKKPAVSIAEVVRAVAENIQFSGGDVTTQKIIEVFESDGIPIRTLQRNLKIASDQGYLRKGKKRSTWMLGSKPLPAD